MSVLSSVKAPRVQASPLLWATAWASFSELEISLGRDSVDHLSIGVQEVDGPATFFGRVEMSGSNNGDVAAVLE